MLHAPRCGSTARSFASSVYALCRKLSLGWNHFWDTTTVVVPQFITAAVSDPMRVFCGTERTTKIRWGSMGVSCRDAADTQIQLTCVYTRAPGRTFFFFFISLFCCWTTVVSIIGTWSRSKKSGRRRRRSAIFCVHRRTSSSPKKCRIDICTTLNYVISWKALGSSRAFIQVVLFFDEKGEPHLPRGNRSA